MGGCFETVAEASSLMADAGCRRGAVERALPLLAETRSMLRQALHRLQAPDDPDQLAAYEWVRGTTARHRIYLKRFMRADDQADPSRWPEVQSGPEGQADEVCVGVPDQACQDHPVVPVEGPGTARAGGRVVVPPGPFDLADNGSA